MVDLPKTGDTRSNEELSIAVATNTGFAVRKLLRDLKPELGSGLYYSLMFILKENEAYLDKFGKTVPPLTSFD